MEQPILVAVAVVAMKQHSILAQLVVRELS
jgi:hypothetical protein